ncbi:MAG: response regulator transcription factor [Lachnospiraceae bacterium]|nr:response regulator transcription factor [Lachnospiraceae bacterium]
MDKILVVEDEDKIARFVELELKHEQYEVDIAGDGKLALEKILNNSYDLIILDIMIPFISGLEVCKKAREEGIDTPIIMLTARDDVSDKVSGLNIGADDYLTKPFDMEELIARIRVAINRSKKMHGVDDKQILRLGKLKINKADYTVHYDEEEIVLTKKEYDLLEYLVENKNTAIDRETLLNKVWGYEYFGDTNVVDVYIRYLRTKIDDKYSIKLISTVRGVGYIVKDM